MGTPASRHERPSQPALSRQSLHQHSSAHERDFRGTDLLADSGPEVEKLSSSPRWSLFSRNRRPMTGIMDVMRNLMANGEVLVVETELSRFLGTVEVRDGEFVVRSGFVGRPVVLSASDVVSVTTPDP